MNRTVLICAIVAALVLAAHQVVVHLVDKMVNVSVEFGSELDELQSRESFTASVRRQEEAPALKDAAPLEEPQPFREVEAFDENAQDWSSFFDGYAPTGVLVFDANRDGRLDLYLSRNGNSWVRPTD